MDWSSPLAAMQPTNLGHPWERRLEMGGAPSFLSTAHTRNGFDFRQLSMMQPPDTKYLSCKPIRGASPAATLAVDLSQNFHIDQSPHPPTPRRSLFTTAYDGPPCKGVGMTPLLRRSSITTHPIPSSSPPHSSDPMDISPLPHKPPFSFVSKPSASLPQQSTQANFDGTTIERQMVDVPDSASIHTADERIVPNLNDRPRAPFPRSSFSRFKGLSTGGANLKQDGLECLPSFRFGSASRGSQDNAIPSLSDCFAQSPPAERKVLPPSVMGGSRQRSSFGTVAHSRQNTNVPLHSRKASSRVSAPPRKQFRRSLSMFESPGDVIKQEKAEYKCTGLESILDVDGLHQLRLPHFVPDNEPDGLPRISDEILINILDGKYGESFDDILIVDCRFEYEFEGGHIDGAVNFNDKELLSEKLFKGLAGRSTLLVLHCEYSAHRAPIMAKFVRHRDRAVNDFQYPTLTYPELYILDGGYSSFFKTHRVRCFPQSYVEMAAKEHENACERGLTKFRQRAKLNRAQTFAFGQKSLQTDESPTAQLKPQCPSFEISNFSTFFLQEKSVSFGWHGRRMASY